MIEFIDVTKVYKDKKVLSNASFKVHDGEFFVLVGASGSGKTTTLKMVNRLIEATSGDIFIDGVKITDLNLRTHRLETGYVLQQIALFPNLTVQENIELIPEMKGWAKEKRLERTKELLNFVHLDPTIYLKRKPSELSGGEQQRIGILRAIAANPKIILMDEPFSALDPISREGLQQLIKQIHHQLQSTVLFVTHDMQEATILGDKIAVMNQGVIQQIDTPENIQQKPANQFVADLFQKHHHHLEDYSTKELQAEIERRGR
jgi:osmoprotectant transport system ATP-binding protein